MPRDLRLKPPVDALEYELVQEQASAFGRMGRAMEAALARLREFDAAQAGQEPSASARQERRQLVLEAGHALWMFVVQRESCGLRDTRTMMREYKVPAEVQQCMGLMPPASKR